MRTADFSSILFESLQLAGQDRNNIQDETFAQFRDFANARLRFAWQAYEWPEIIRYFEAPILNLNGVVCAQVPAEGDEVIGAYSAHPLATTSLREYAFTIFYEGDNKYLAFKAAPVSLFIAYKVKNPVISGDIWNSDYQYVVGSQVYFDIGAGAGSATSTPGKPCIGNFYTCLSATTPGQSPTTHPAKWQKVEIPYFLSTYLPRGMHADWLRSEMQLDLANIAEQDSEAILGEEIGRVTKTQGQSTRLNIINTY